MMYGRTVWELGSSSSGIQGLPISLVVLPSSLCQSTTNFPKTLFLGSDSAERISLVFGQQVQSVVAESGKLEAYGTRSLRATSVVRSVVRGSLGRRCRQAWRSEHVCRT